MGFKWYEPHGAEKVGIDNASAAAVAAQVAAEKVVFSNGNSGSAKTITRANGRYQKVVLSASAPTLTITGFTAGSYGEILLYVVQDATGSRLLPTFSPAGRYGAAGAPTLSTAANAVDVLRLSSIDGGSTLQVALVEKGA